MRALRFHSYQQSDTWKRHMAYLTKPSPVTFIWRPKKYEYEALVAWYTRKNEVLGQKSVPLPQNNTNPTWTRPGVEAKPQR